MALCLPRIPHLRSKEPLTPPSPRKCGARERESVFALQDLSDPVVRVGHATVLDVDQLLAQPHGDGAGCAAADEKIAARRTHLADRRDHGRRAAGERLLQLAAAGIGAPLVDRVTLLA